MTYEEGGLDFIPVKVNTDVLKALPRSDVIVCDWPKPLKYQYFKNLMPDVQITKCKSCNKVRVIKILKGV